MAAEPQVTARGVGWETVCRAVLRQPVFPTLHGVPVRVHAVIGAQLWNLYLRVMHTNADSDEVNNRVLIQVAKDSNMLTIQLWSPHSRFFKPVREVVIKPEEILALGLKTNSDLLRVILARIPAEMTAALVEERSQAKAVPTSLRYA